MSLRIALAQLDLFVGDVGGNAQRVIDASAEARDRLKADLVLFPELSLSGYPPEDLLFHKGMRRQVAAALERVRSEVSGVAVMVGYPDYTDDAIYNAAALIREGKVFATARSSRTTTSRSCRTISSSTRSATSNPATRVASSRSTASASAC